MGYLSPREAAESRIECCIKLTEALNEFMLMLLMTNIPWQPDTSISPTIFILSGNKEDGYESIKYCPFCGVEIKFKE